MTERSRTTPAWLVERLAQNELSEEQKRRLTVESSTLAQLERSNEETLAAYPPAEVSKEIRRRFTRTEPRPEANRRWVFALVPAVAAVFLVLWAGQGVTPPPHELPVPPEDDIRIKGLTPKLQIYRQKGEKAERLASKSKVHQGDYLQLTYIAAEKPFGVIVSLDGRGVVTRHLPEKGDNAALLEQKGEIPLSESYKLDDAPKFECFYFVTSDAPFSVETVFAAAEQLKKLPDPMAKPLPLPPGLSQSWIMLQKESL